MLLLKPFISFNLKNYTSNFDIFVNLENRRCFKMGREGEGGKDRGSISSIAAGSMMIHSGVKLTENQFKI